MRSSRLQRISGLSLMVTAVLSASTLVASSIVFAQVADESSTALAQAQVWEEWVARYDGPSNSTDRAIALAVDEQGSVYVTGSSASGIGPNYNILKDYATLKYNCNGNLLWEQRYNGPGNANDEATALIVDERGNVYVTGNSEGNGTGNDFATVKYDRKGTLLWVQRYNGLANSGDFPTALAVDKQGNVYVTGSSEGNGTDRDYATLKYDPNGKLLWAQLYNGPSNEWDEASALAVDQQGNVYVTGTICISNNSIGMCRNQDYGTLKYDPNGKLLWAQLYNGPSNGWDEASALAVDQQGNIYVTGRSEGGVTNTDYATLKYDSNGKLLWEQRYNGPGNYSDSATALAVDKHGNVYLTGRSEGSGTNTDYATLKYDPNGTLLWKQRYNGPGNGSDAAQALAVDVKGNVYVTGTICTSVVIGGWCSTDYATLRYAPNGTLLWEQRYHGPGNSLFNGASAITVDRQGNVYVTGLSEDSNNNPDYVTIKYSQGPGQQPAQ